MNDVKTGAKIIADTLSTSIQDVLKVMSRAENSALRAGANVIKRQTKKNLKSSGISLSKTDSKYDDSLMDAIRVSRPENGDIKVHIMGTRRKTSGTFRLRFFEGGTKVRYNKTVKGTPLNKKRKVGQIGAHNFFANALSSSAGDVENAMDKALTKYIEKAWNNG